jgi:hypothetical protein
MQNRKVFVQKLNYIHNNPCAAGLSAIPKEYKSAEKKVLII